MSNSIEQQMTDPNTYNNDMSPVHHSNGTKDSSLHEVTDISTYSIEDQIGLIKSIKNVLKQANPVPMVSYLYPDSKNFSFEQNHNTNTMQNDDGILIYGKNWTYQYKNSDNNNNNHNNHNNSSCNHTVEIIIGRNCDNTNPETISLHQLNFKINKLPIDIDLGPNKTVSRKHIIIHKLKNPQNDQSQDGWYITVLGRNSCKINLKRVPNNKLNVPIGPLKSGTSIDVGGSQMILYMKNDLFPILSLPIYSYIIPRLTTMYGLNGNNNPLLKDIINTSTYVKEKNLQIDNDQDEQQTESKKDEIESVELDNTINSISPMKQSGNKSSNIIITATSSDDNNKDKNAKTDEVIEYDQSFGDTQGINNDDKNDNNNNNNDNYNHKNDNLKAVQFYTTTKTTVTTTTTTLTATTTIGNNTDQVNINTPTLSTNKLLKRVYSNEEQNESNKKINKSKEITDIIATTNTITTLNKDSRIKRPSWPYTVLITRAILSSPEGCLPLSKIYEYISNLHPFYDMSITSWQNSVRHNLSINSTFVKTVNSENVSCWKLNDNVIQDFLENWYQGNLIKLKKNGGVIIKELCIFMTKDDARFPGQREPEYYQKCYMKKLEAEKLGSKQKEQGKLQKKKL